MKIFVYFFLYLALCSSLYPQNKPDTGDPDVTLTSEQCYDTIKTVWDGLKKIAEDYNSEIAVKSEFETHAEFAQRLAKTKAQFVNKVNKFFLDKKLESQTYSVWLKANLVRYSADSQVYRVKSSAQILIQPRKDDIVIITPSNKYVSIIEKNELGYRRANLQLNTTPEFTWFVNKETAQAAKNKESQIYFKLWFKFNVAVNDADNQIVLKVVPMKLALMSQQDNFTYWSEDIQ